MRIKNLSLLRSFISEYPDHRFDKELLKTVCIQFPLELNGIHGVYHWHRVYNNALKLAKHYEIDSKVFMLFALFHDSKRENDNIDPLHGKRGGRYAKSIQNDISVLKALSKEELELLEYACSSHTKTDYEHAFSDNLIANICWDADRLDIGRVGFIVNPDYLHTDYAKELASSLLKG